MSIQSDQLKERAMAFADKTLRLVDRLPQAPGARVIAKLAVVVEEADESLGTAHANARFRHPIPNPPIVKTITR